MIMADEKKPAPKAGGAKGAAPKPAAKKGAAKTRKSSLYKIEGGKLIRLRKSCPRCGSGVFLAQHKNRASCGKCGYSETKTAPN